MVSLLGRPVLDVIEEQRLLVLQYSLEHPLTVTAFRLTLLLTRYPSLAFALPLLQVQLLARFARQRPPKSFKPSCNGGVDPL